MPKNLFLLSLATITLAATTLTNVASSKADTAVIIPSDNSPRGCAAVVPAPPGCASPSTPSNPLSVADRVHILPYPYPSPFFGSIPISPFPYPNSPKSEPPATQPSDCIDCVYGTSAK
jgi:hypothetical protein